MSPPPAIVYLEVPCFYAAVERALDPSLVGRPVVVGGNPRKHGQVQSASPEALAAGVKLGMPMLEALERCPEARAIKTDMGRYRERSGQLRASLRREVAAIEPQGLEAAYVDASDAGDEPATLAERLCDRVRRDLGLRPRAGIAQVKFLAKLAAEESGSKGILQIALGQEAEFLRPLPVGRLPGVGPKTVQTLSGLGVRWVGDLARVDASRIEQALGNHGLRILDLARGHEDSPVRVARHPQSLSKEQRFSEPQRDLGVLWEHLQRLSQAIEQALRREGLEARRVALKVRYPDGETSTRSETLPEPVSSSGAIYARAQHLLDRTQAPERAVRLLAVTVAGLSDAGVVDRQLDLFSPID